MGEAHGFCRALPGGRRHRRIAHPGRTAAADHKDSGNRRATHGPAECHYPAVTCGRDTRVSVADLLGQDGYTDTHGNDGGVRRNGRVVISDHRRWLFAEW